MLHGIPKWMLCMLAGDALLLPKEVEFRLRLEQSAGLSCVGRSLGESSTEAQLQHTSQQLNGALEGCVQVPNSKQVWALPPTPGQVVVGGPHLS